MSKTPDKEHIKIVFTMLLNANNNVSSKDVENELIKMEFEIPEKKIIEQVMEEVFSKNPKIFYYYANNKIKVFFIKDFSTEADFFENRSIDGFIRNDADEVTLYLNSNLTIKIRAVLENERPVLTIERK